MNRSNFLKGLFALCVASVLGPKQVFAQNVVTPPLFDEERRLRTRSQSNSNEFFGLEETVSYDLLSVIVAIATDSPSGVSNKAKSSYSEYINEITYSSSKGLVKGRIDLNIPNEADKIKLIGILNITQDFLPCELKVEKDSNQVTVSGNVGGLETKVLFDKGGKITGHYISSQFGKLSVDGGVTEYDANHLPKTMEVLFYNNANRFRFRQTTTYDNGIITGHEAKRTN
jgi:hypothetical protein